MPFRHPCDQRRSGAHDTPGAGAVNSVMSEYRTSPNGPATPTSTYRVQLNQGLTLADALFDLDYIEALPGQKILVKGNHDYWWQSLSRVREAAGCSLHFLQHSAFGVGPWAVCGTRGWLLPSHADFKQEEDGRLLHRELLRLEMALEEAAALDRPIIVMLHYPPLDDPKQDSPFTELIGRYPAVTDCVYGHIHGDKAPAFEGVYKGVRYQNCSIDRLDFTPRLIAEE